jgi:hypothetical protein
MLRRRKKRKRPNGWFGFLKAHMLANLHERGHLPELNEGEVLAWADAWMKRTGQLPHRHSWQIPEAPNETWLDVEAASGVGN